MEFKLYLLDSWDHSFPHDELKCYVIFQLNSVLESLLSKVARYDQGSILAPMFSLMVCIGLPLPSLAPSPFCAPMSSSEYVLDCVAGVRRRGRGGGEKRERERGRETGSGECAFLPLPSPAPSPFCALMFSSEYVLDCVAGVRRRGRGGGEFAFLSLPLPRSPPSLCLPRRLDMYLWNDCQNPVILPSRFQQVYLLGN